MRILLVEDEPYMAEAVAQVLKNNNFTVDIAAEGEMGLDCGLSNIYDIIILDVMLPKLDGYQITRNLRKEGIATPIILLTAKGSVDDKVFGLDSGADDYLAKPFQMEELMARIRALVRRQPLVGKTDELTYLDLTLYPSLLKVCCGGRESKLTLKESQVLEHLMKHREQVVSKGTLIECIWGFDTEAEDNHVEVYISFLRKKLHYLKSKVAIKTKRGIGYILGEIYV